MDTDNEERENSNQLFYFSSPGTNKTLHFICPIFT